MKIKFSDHAERKINERELNPSIAKNVLNNPDSVFYDLESKTLVAIAQIRIAGAYTNLVIPYIEENDTIKIVTLYPCKDIENEIKRKEGVRWIRIK